MYDVNVTREGDWWLGEVTGETGMFTCQLSLKALRQGMQEVIILMEDLPDDAHVNVRFHADASLPVDVRAAFDLAARRERAEAQLRKVQEDTMRAIRTLHGEGFSVRDIGEMVGITGGRVHQLFHA